jgi:hypothetical protein
LSREIDSPDYVANAAISEAADRIEELSKSNDFERDAMKADLDEAMRACYIWQKGHSDLVKDRDYWKNKAEELAADNRHLENQFKKTKLDILVEQAKTKYPTNEKYDID